MCDTNRWLDFWDIEERGWLAWVDDNGEEQYLETTDPADLYDFLADGRADTFDPYKAYDEHPAISYSKEAYLAMAECAKEDYERFLAAAETAVSEKDL